MFLFGPLKNAGPNLVTSALTRGTGSTTISIGNGATMIVNSNVTITLNNSTNGAAFVSGNQDDWAATILHELGHVYWDLYGAGTSKILPDENSPQTSLDNTKLIKKDCNLGGKL